MHQHHYQGNTGDHYWRLNDYQSTSVDTLRLRVGQAGYSTAIRIKKVDIVKIMHRIHRQLPNYRGCTLAELRKFATDRKLLFNPRTSKHKQLVRILTAADDELEFSRLFDLPPELRCNIYRWYMASFPESPHAVPQPPLTQISKAVRVEATPVFYQCCHFKIDLDPSRGAQEFIRFARPAHHFLASTTSQHLACIRRFQFQYCRHLGYGMNSYAYQFEVELKTGEKGFLPQVKARKLSIGRVDRELVPDENCGKIESALTDVFGTREATEVEGKEARLRVEDLYVAKRKMEEILCSG